MPTVVAIDILDDNATLVTGETTGAGEVRILSVREMAVPDVTFASEEEEEQFGEEGTAEDTVGDDSNEAFPQPETESEFSFAEDDEAPEIDELVDADVDYVLALAPSRHVLFQNFSLPFKDQKKIDAVAPLQVQELVPFDLSDFVIDAVVVSSEASGGYEILSSMIPRRDVVEALAKLRALGADPKLLTSRAQSIAGLVELNKTVLQGSFGLILLSHTECSLAIFIDDELRVLRDFELGENHVVSAIQPDLVRDLRCSIAQAESKYHLTFEHVFISGPPSLRQELTAKLMPLRLTMIDFSDCITRDPSVEVATYDINWALGLIAGEAKKSGKKPLLNFRQGPFAYRPSLGNFVAAIKEEMFYIVAAVGIGILWCLTAFYTAYSQLNDIENKIDEAISLVMPAGEQVPEKGEANYLKEKVDEVQSQLRGLGSLSSLSPLDSLMELSAIISQDIDIDIDKMNIGNTAVRFSGSVQDHPAVGRLDDALKSRPERFCDAEAVPAGQVPRSHRVKFRAEVNFCE